MNEFKCEWCEATTAKRTGQPFTEGSLRAHRIRGCPKAPATVAATVADATVASEVIRDSGKSTKSLSSTVADRPSLSSSEEERNNTAAEAAAVVANGEEKGESESIAALWARHKYDRTENGRPVFTRFEHSLMSRDWKHLTAKQRDTLKGIHAALRAHAFEVQQQEAEFEAMAKSSHDPVLIALEIERKEKAESMARWVAELEAEAALNPPPPPREPMILPHQLPHELTEAEIAETWSDFARPWLIAKKAFLAGALDSVNWTPESRKAYEASRGRG